MSGPVTNAEKRSKKRVEKEDVKRYLLKHGVTNTDPELAALLGTTKDTVSQVRKELGLETYSDIRRRCLLADPEFLTAPLEVLAKRHNYSAQGVRDVRKNSNELYADTRSAWINPVLRRWARRHVELMK